ncbi:hypothetical protein Patl1_14023 [Pistacia atlantica]|uniref:Uncharacterized protein n=1 Tax=Pistacia atlantica TaxID=434234 RepID=A0ACC1AUA9_9ROSI|nr:hypothetical protein Patl1_14023 [Pistacia atlantica]
MFFVGSESSSLTSFFVGLSSSSSDFRQTLIGENGNRFSPSHTVDDKAFSTLVSEASVSRNRNNIIVPAGSSRDEGWTAFRNILAEINEASRLFILHNQASEPSERLVRLSDDVGAGFISGHSSQPASASELNVDRSVDLPAQDEIGNMGVSKVIRADQKRFFFDLGSNNMGHFLRISEIQEYAHGGSAQWLSAHGGFAQWLNAHGGVSSGSELGEKTLFTVGQWRDFAGVLGAGERRT